MATVNRKSNPLTARIICEQQFLRTNAFRIVIELSNEKVIQGSPLQLMKKTSVIKQLTPQHLSRLAFLAGVEHTYVMKKRIEQLGKKTK